MGSQPVFCFSRTMGALAGVTGMALISRASGFGAAEQAIPLSAFKRVTIGKGSGLPFDWAVSYTDQALNLDWLGLMGRCSSATGHGSWVSK